MLKQQKCAKSLTETGHLRYCATKKQMAIDDNDLVPLIVPSASAYMQMRT